MVSVLRLLNLDIAGVDLLFNNGSYSICEVNSSPGFEGMDRFCKTNINRTNSYLCKIQIRLMVIVNSKEKWSSLQKVMRTTHFVYLQILSDVHKHSKQNRVSCFLIVTPFEKYIVPVNHNERFGKIEKIDCSESKVCVGDMKSFLHNSMIEADEIFGLIDLNWCHYNKTNESYDFDKHLTNVLSSLSQIILR